MSSSKTKTWWSSSSSWRMILFTRQSCQILDIIHSTVEAVPLDSNWGKNLKDSISEDSGSEDGKLEPEYLDPDHIRETNFEEHVESLEIPELHQQSLARVKPFKEPATTVRGRRGGRHHP